MSLRDEIEVFNKVKISADTRETEVWDKIIFPNVIRKRENELISDLVEKIKPKRILDFGCGTGWLSKMLSSNGYHTVGVDISDWLVRNARASCSESEKSQFIVGDGMNLPFRAGIFDLTVGIGALHHLDPDQGLAECYRVTSKKGVLLLMEPNKLNPIGAIGRKIAPLDTHTKGEKPFTPMELRKALLRNGWVIRSFKYLFPFSFSLARLLRKARWKNQKFESICRVVEASEKLFEEMPLLNQLCSTIFMVAEKE